MADVAEIAKRVEAEMARFHVSESIPIEDIAISVIERFFLKFYAVYGEVGVTDVIRRVDDRIRKAQKQRAESLN